jgi:hypothetical protein
MGDPSFPNLGGVFGKGWVLLLEGRHRIFPMGALFPTPQI